MHPHGVAPGLLIDGRAGGEPLSERSERRSRVADDGTRLAHADLHNHTLLSDGQGRPEEAFASLRRAGLDVAALTDHARIGYGVLSRLDPCAALGKADEGAWRLCRSTIGLDEQGWRRSGALADAADEEGSFTAIRGFEWTHPTLGHVNVWDSQEWIDALHTSGFGWDGIGDAARRLPGLGPVLHHLLSALPGDPGMQPLYDWLLRQGDDDSGPLAGFNHPGREPGAFDAFRYDPRLGRRLVSLEVFNKTDEYLFDGPDWSPLAACLDAGWRVGLIGVSDEHGTDWGVPEGKGRGGLWVRTLSRAGVREALQARRFFATRERGLRVDATANGVRMGGTLPHRRGPVTFALDIAQPAWVGRRVQVQVLRPGGAVPAVVEAQDVAVPDERGPTLALTVDLDAADGDWAVLRVADPDAPNPRPGPDGHPGNLRGLAYASPFWLDPGARP